MSLAQQIAEIGHCDRVLGQRQLDLPVLLEPVLCVEDRQTDQAAVGAVGLSTPSAVPIQSTASPGSPTFT